jgi:hypothetical protein
MAVQEDNLGYGVPKLNRFIPATQTKHVAGVMHAPDPGVRLTRFDRHEAGTHEAAKTRWNLGLTGRSKPRASRVPRRSTGLRSLEES